MTRWYVLDADGEPMPSLVGGLTEEQCMAWRVGIDEIGASTVSTVFLGLDHAHNGGPPVLWETMVFGGDLDGEQERYTSRADAVAGHAAMVARVKS